MSIKVPRALLRARYEREAAAYLHSLPLEHFAEAIVQATQREITLESLALVKARRPDVHVFNELLVLYPVEPRRGGRKLEKVVPDNMVVISSKPIEATGSYNVPLEPAGPYWVLEYVSTENKRKDYVDSFAKYERDLKVPYYLVFHPEAGELTLYRHNQRKYTAVKPNVHGRLAVRKLDVEVALVDGWVRYWHQGELLLLPAELERNLATAQRHSDEMQQLAAVERRRADEERRRADELQTRLAAAERELAALRASRPWQ